MLRATVLAIVGSATAFSPMMSMETGRRQILQAGASAAVVAPLLRANPATAAGNRSGRAPVITIFDHRGCQRGGPNKEYEGGAANGPDDEMLVKVGNPVITVSDATATRQLNEVISFKAKAIDGDYTACSTTDDTSKCKKPGVDSGRGGPAYPRL
eukprot:CAMPEP_0173076524 /NCGR_PEP_ID=MMETSP1102-20130122/12478_1 /TAXON_ID=49646 /ORGANISM="Geminigera sp., Strain Caron Lab Isolate" /LENGTH=154 /DNA_ID=CAMNT_0013946429 /DNA_START=81 /DNA_END=545 /DNA_ORIENTATION=+